MACCPKPSNLGTSRPVLSNTITFDGFSSLYLGKQHLLHEAGAPGLAAFDLLEADLVDDEELCTLGRLECLHVGVVGQAHVQSGEHVRAGGVECTIRRMHGTH